MPNGQKEFIEKYRRDKFGLDIEGKPSTLHPDLLSDFNDALTKISKDVYSDDIHFLFELIQNAQDNTYAENIVPTLSFLLLAEDPTETEDSEGCLCVFNNEIGFNQEDIKSICSVGSSTKKLKKMEGFIGEKGIGFKSVFKISSSPHIFSGGYHIRFFDEDKISGIKFITPYWIDAVPDIVASRSDYTAILLPIRKGKYQSIRTGLLEHKGEVALFLEKLDRIEIEIPDEKYAAVFQKQISANGNLCITSEVNGVADQCRFVVVEKQVEVPSDLLEEKRKGVKNRTISLAYPLEPYDSISVFGYLPTKMNSSLPFVINADFLLIANRESINDTEWNTWLISEVADFVAEDLAEQIVKGRLGTKGYSFIPARRVAKDKKNSFAVVAAGLLEALKTQPVVLGDDQEWHLPVDTRIVGKSFRKIFSEAPRDLGLHWAELSIQEYDDQLRAIGVKSVSKPERLKVMGSQAWLAERSAEWFSSYYRYLDRDNFASANRSDFSQLPLLPTETGEIFCVAAERVFLPLEESEEKIPTGHYFPPPPTFNSALLALIRVDGELQEFVDAHLNLNPFNHEYYFFKLVHEGLEKHSKQASLADKKALIRYLLKHWDHLNVDGWNYEGDLPVLLEDETLLVNTSEDERQRIIPRKANNAISWDKVFTHKDELKHFAALHPFYEEFSDSQLEKYFETLDVEEWPDLISHTISRYESLGDEYVQYEEYLERAFFGNSDDFPSRYVKTVEANLLPLTFWSVSKIKSTGRKSLIAYFDWLIDHMRTSTKRSLGSYYNRTDKATYLDSIFDFYLKRHPWLQTSQGYKPPPECFVDDPNLRRFLGKSVPYIVDRLPDKLVQLLGILTEASSENILSYLRELSSQESKPTKSAARGIYDALARNNDVAAEDFGEAALVFIPDVGWKSLAEVIWEDPSEIAADSFFGLDNHFPISLKSFFVEKLGVKEALDASNYAALWLSLQQKGNPDEHRLRLYEKCFARIRSEIRTEPDADWLVAFKDEAKLYAGKYGWLGIYDYPEPFLPDDKRFQKAFDGLVPYIKRITDHTFDWMEPVTGFLEIEKLSSVVQMSLSRTSESLPTEQNRYITDYSRRLICMVLANKTSDGREYLEQIEASGKLKDFFQIQEQVVDQLSVEAGIPDANVNVVLRDEAAYLDEENGFLYINSASDEDDVLDTIEEILLSFLLAGIALPKPYEDSFVRFLAVQEEKTFKKHRERKGSDWVLPRPIFEEIEKLIKNRDPLVITDAIPEPELESFPDPDDKNTSEKRSGELGSPATGGPKGISEEPGKSEGSKQASPGGGRVGSGSKGKSAPGGGTGSTRGFSSVRGGRSKSSGISAKINQARRSKLRSYVVPEGFEAENDDAAANQEAQKRRQELGEQAELIVLEDYRAKGYEAKRMRTNNPGYDIKAVDPGTGEVHFVEVKGDSYAWGDKGVGISRTQYDLAEEKGATFVLAVVDNLTSIPSEPSYIRDPFLYITEYRFDGGWRQLSTPLLPASSAVEFDNTLRMSVLDRLSALTESADCKHLITFCESSNFPLPEIGLELEDEHGTVVVENIELAWEPEKIAVFLSDEEKVEDKALVEGWQMFDVSEIDQVESALMVAFRTEGT